MEESDDDLLERARRLCLAAQVIAASLPVFSSLRTASGGSGNQDEEIPTSTKKSRGYAKNSSSTAARKSRPEAGSQSSLSLPVAVVPATASTALVTRKRSLKNLQKSELSSTNQEVLPDIIISDEQRRLREIEKIRHAQERARARVSRTNQSDQLEAERENESRRQQLLQLTEVSAEKARLAEQSRLRAEERIRTKRQLQLTPIEKQQQVPICPEKPAPDLVKIERFRRKTLARLHGLPRAPDGVPTTKSTGQSEPENSSEPSTVDGESCDRDEDVKADMRRQNEKRLRQETSERVRRQQVIEEQQRRKEQDHIEQGLLRYKNRQKELDRVAKGLGPPRKPETTSKPTVEIHPSSEPSHEESLAGAFEPPDEANAMPQDRETQERSSRSTSPDCRDSKPLDHNSPQSEDDLPPSLTIALDHHHLHQTVPTMSSGATSGGKRKIPPWKRAPVPVLPAEFYSCKAIIPAAPSSNSQSVSATASNSYTEKFKSRAPSANSGTGCYSTSSTLSKPRVKPPSRDVASAAAAVRLGSATRDRAQQITQQELHLGGGLAVMKRV